MHRVFRARGSKASRGSAAIGVRAVYYSLWTEGYRPENLTTRTQAVYRGVRSSHPQCSVPKSEYWISRQEPLLSFIGAQYGRRQSVHACGGHGGETPTRQRHCFIPCCRRARRGLQWCAQEPLRKDGHHLRLSHFCPTSSLVRSLFFIIIGYVEGTHHFAPSSRGLNTTAGLETHRVSETLHS